MAVPLATVARQARHFALRILDPHGNDVAIASGAWVYRLRTDRSAPAVESERGPMQGMPA